MRVAVLTSASAGGAGIAAKRLYEALSAQRGFDVWFFDISTFGESVKESISPGVNASNHIVSNTHFTIDRGKSPREWVVNLLSGFDVVNIHWASYLLSLSEIYELAKTGTRILFTLHDYYYFTGGCHYPAGCLNYLDSCEGCPQLKSEEFSYLEVVNNLELKRAIFKFPNVHISAPSNFLINEAVNSGIVPEGRAHLLRNIYVPIEASGVSIPIKVKLGKKQIILIADSFNERRKGISLAVSSLQMLPGKLQRNVVLHVVGNVNGHVLNQLQTLSIELRLHGRITDHIQIKEIYEASDYILSCSYEDNWPNILVEAGAYGCIPIVGRWHGCEEFVNYFNIGFISEDYSPEQFSLAISNALKADFSQSTLSKYSKKVVQEHSLANVGKTYTDLLRNNLLETHTSGQLAGNHKGSFSSNMASVEVYKRLHACEESGKSVKEVRLTIEPSPFGSVSDERKEMRVNQPNSLVKSHVCHPDGIYYGLPRMRVLE